MTEPKKKGSIDWRKTEPKVHVEVPGRHPKANKGITPEAFEKALRKAGGLYADTARLLGITRHAVRARIVRSKKLQALVAEIKEGMLDLAESKLVAAIKKGNLGAICFYLKTQGRSRGYGELVELTTADGTAVRFYVPKKDELPPSDEAVPELSDVQAQETTTPPAG